MKKEINKNTLMEDKYTLCVGYVNKEGQNIYTDIEIACSSIEEERVELVNKILNIKDVKEVTSIDLVEEEDIEDDDYYDAEHAQEWMERNPHGYYNSEKDYGVDDEDDTLEYAFKDNFR